MKAKVKLISSLVLLGMLFTLTGAAWAAESSEGERLLGQVTDIDGNTLVVSTVGGEEVRVVTNPHTHFRIPGVSEPSIADVDVGDYIAAQGQRNGNGALVAELVFVLPERLVRQRYMVRGEVLAINGLSLTVQAPLGERLVITDQETRFWVRGVEEPTIEDIAIGDPIVALGRPDDQGNLLARIVVVVSGPQLRRHTIRGLITAIEGNVISVTTRQGEVQVLTTEGTVFRIPGVEDPGVDGLHPRDLIVAVGTRDGEERVLTARIVGLIPRWPSHLRFLRGEVTAVEGSTIVLKALQGELAVLTDDETVFRIPGVEDPGLEDLQMGDKAGALVTRAEEGSLLAKAVIVRRGESSFTATIMAPVEAVMAAVDSLLGGMAK
jgi:hypothetical protein